MENDADPSPQPAAVPVSRGERLLIAAVLILTILGSILVSVIALRAADIGPLQLTVERAGPRPVEEQTEKAVRRDYAAAWKARVAALENNDPSALGELWIGFARHDLLDAIGEQRRSGLSVRYVDQGHHADAIFYSPEGSALELHDTAQLERQILDGDSVSARKTSPPTTWC